jgi:hypothetical protein
MHPNEKKFLPGRLKFRRKKKEPGNPGPFDDNQRESILYKGILSQITFQLHIGAENIPIWLAGVLVPGKPEKDLILAARQARDSYVRPAVNPGGRAEGIHIVFPFFPKLFQYSFHL